MTEILITWAALTAAMWVAAGLLPSMEIRGGVKSHLLVSASFGLFMLATGWIFHLALGVLGVGLSFVLGFVARVVVGAIVLKLTDAVSDRLRVEGMGTAVLASLVISVVGGGVEALAHAI